MDSTNTTEGTDAGKAKGHRHAGLMAEFARDAAVMERPWEAWEFLGSGRIWETCVACPVWQASMHYRRKRRTIRIGEMDVAEPVRDGLERGTRYWVPAVGASDYVTSGCGLVWAGDHYDAKWMRRGLVHLTLEAAAAHGRALVALTEGKV